MNGRSVKNIEEYTLWKGYFLINVPMKIGYSHVKNESKPLSLTMYKNQHQMN